MKILQALACLPPSLFVLISTIIDGVSAQGLPWPYNLPPHVKYYPEDEMRVKRDVEIEQKLQRGIPAGVKKMSPDPGEKFFLEYWMFEGQSAEIVEAWGNSSQNTAYQPPLQLHSNEQPHRLKLPAYIRLPLAVRASFDKRDFQCPVGSQDCRSIDRPNSCCAEGSTCQIIQDSGLGDVGCCPSNEICSGSLSQCPAGGYSSCPNNPGGGCCLPDYQCFDVGCILTRTAMVTATPTSLPTIRSTVTETSTVIVNPPPPSTTSSPPPPSPTTSTVTPTTSTPPNTLVCSPGYRSCPASEGGGCCPTNRACGRDICPELSSTNTFIAPGRPTSDSASATTTAPSLTTTTSLSISGCPTGFYACSAVYQGGCCRTGRNCDTTSCPVTGSITVVDGSTITAVAPTGSGISSAATLLTGACANGWSTCAPSVGGGCCPAGYTCGTACTATASGGHSDQVGKIAPNAASRTRGTLSAEILFGWCIIFSIATAQMVFS